MADFNVSNPGGGVSSPFRASQPVTNDAISSGINTVGKLVDAGLGIFSETKKREQATQVAGITQSFRMAELEIADAVSQGRLSSEDAGSRLLAVYANFTSQYPTLADDFTKVHQDIVNTAGLGKIAIEGTREEQRKNALMDKAVADLYVDPSADAYTQELQFQNWAESQRAREDLAEIQARESLVATQLGNDSSRLSLERQRMQYQAQRATSTLASTETVRFENQMAQLVKGFEEGTLTQDEAQRLARQHIYGVRATAAQVGANAGADYVNALVAPMEMLFQNTMAVIDGKESLENVQRKNDMTMALATAGWLSDPERARIATGSSIFPNSDLLRLQTRTAEPITRYLQGGLEDGVPANPFPNTPADKEGFQSYLNVVLRPAMQRDVGGTATPAESEEIERSVSNLMRSIPAYSGVPTDLRDYSHIVDFLSSPEFGRYVSAKGSIPADLAGAAFSILQMNYEQPVSEVIRDFWEKPSTAMVPHEGRAWGSQVRTGLVPKDLLQPVFVGSGVTFVAKDGLSPEDRRAATHLIQKANRELSPVMNKLIRMGAHFDGNTNYRAVFNESYPRLFGLEEEQAQEEGDV